MIQRNPSFFGDVREFLPKRVFEAHTAGMPRNQDRSFLQSGIGLVHRSLFRILYPATVNPTTATNKGLTSIEARPFERGGGYSPQTGHNAQLVLKIF